MSQTLIIPAKYSDRVQDVMIRIEQAKRDHADLYVFGPTRVGSVTEFGMEFHIDMSERVAG